MTYETRQAWIDSVRQAIDIVEVVGRHVVLKRKGRHWWGLCPFHAEKTPSFSVDAEQQLFYCFGCQQGGTAFTFLMKLEGREFRDVVESLAQEAGIPLPDQLGGARPDPHKRLKAVLEWTQEFFQQSFRQNEAMVREYLDARGVDARMVERFLIGYAPDNWHGLKDFLQHRGVSLAEMVEAGVAVKRDQGGGYDRWRGRLMFPIWDREGQVVAFGGRALDPGQEPKYLNSPETPLFHKGQVLYASHLARPSWRKGSAALIVEGYFDVVACHQAGQTQAVGQLGTALTDLQARFISRYTEEVHLLLDQDAAGVDAMRRAFLVLSGVGLKVNVVTLPDGFKDPSELVQKEGVDALVDRILNAAPYVEHEIERAQRFGGLVSPRRQAETVEHLKPLIRAVKDPIERVGYMEMLAKTLRVHPEILTQSFGSSQEVQHTIAKNRHNMGVTAPARRGQPTEVRLLAALRRHPDYTERIRQALPEWASEKRIRVILEDLAAGRLADPEHRSFDGADPEVESLYAAIWHNDEPDGGGQAIDELIWALDRERARRRYDEIKEMLRQGPTTPALMDEIRRLGARLERYQYRKEG
ncbi:MAG: DNA primase [Thermaerobacter sp.]|nr:DNA primase [Thermaerobacter sp.]